MTQTTYMHVLLTFIDRRVNVWLRFGRPIGEVVLDRSRREAVFTPGAVCCRVKWLANDHGTVVWQLLVLQAAIPSEGMQRISGVTAGARILLRAEGEREVKGVLELIDDIELSGVDPCAVAASYWRTVGNRLAARLPLPAYTAERHEANVAREAIL